MGLSPGDRVDRYEIVELLGAGGMGEVYRARDPKLARLVALKILHVDATKGTDGAARILREARAAAALSHANVLTVYDVGEVQEPESLRGTAYIAMELVVGRPLRAYVGDETVSVEKRVGWLRDVAVALGAAHAAGLVHRDVKPENVMIRVDGAVKVLDFGIARRTAASLEDWSSKGHSLPTAPTRPGDASPSTGAGVLVGTPLFMAPEQLRGEALDGRTDQFAWGVMAYLLLTGKVPWEGLSEPFAVLSQILFFEPPAPRDVDARIPAAVSRAIVKALSKEPGSRFASMEELVAALEPGRGGARGWGSGLARGRRARAWIAAALVVALGLTGGLLLARRARMTADGAATPASSGSPGAPAPARRASVAVWPLREAPGGAGAAWLGVALGETLRADLSVDESLLVAPGADVAHARRDLALADGAELTPADEMRAATALGMPLLIEGSYALDAARALKLDVRVVDAKTGKVLGAATESGKEDDLFDLVGRTAASIRRILHVPAPAASVAALARSAMPGPEDAARAYSEGLAALQALDYGAAREQLERAVALDDKAPMPHAMLSRALFELGYIGKAADEAHAALDRAPGNTVTREERLAMEARERECAYDWSAAADRWHVLWEFFPDDIDYGLALSRAYKRGGEPKRALAAVDALRSRPGTATDPRVELAASDAASIFDYEAQATYAAAALAKAKASGSPSLGLEAEVYVARARQNLGKKREELPEIYAELERRYLTLGNRAGAIQIAIRLAHSYTQLSRIDDALRTSRRAIDDAHAYGYVGLEAQALMRLGSMKRRIDQGSAIPELTRSRDLAHSSGERWIEEQSLNELGLAQWKSGKLEEGRASLESAAKISAAIGQKNDETNALDNLAEVYASMGDLRESLATHDQMAKRYLEVGNRDDWVITLESIARGLVVMGEPVEAEKRLDEAATARSDVAVETAIVLDRDRGDVLIARGELAAGRALLQHAVDDRVEAGAMDLASGWTLSLARFDVLHGVSRTAEIERASAGDDSPPAVLAASRLLDGQRDRAVADARRAVAAAQKAHNYFDRVSELVLAADVLARTSHGAEALAIVGPLAIDAASRGAVTWALEARLVAARASGAGAARDAASKAVEAEARAHGLVDLANRAAGVR